MKRIVLVLIASALAVSAAQTPNPQRQADALGKRLGLSAGQIARIQPVLADRDQQMQSLRADASLTKRDLAMKLRALRQDSAARLEAVMTDPQKQQFEAMQQAARERHKKQ